MIDILSRLPDIILPASVAAAEVSEGLTEPKYIGFIVLSIIVGPVVILTLAAIFGKPRTLKVPGLFIGAVVLLVIVILLSFLVSGVLLQFVVPQ